MSEIPDALFPTDNQLDIPVLKLDLQADYLDLPFVPYGSIGRSRKMNGTYHFYVDDRHFSALWKNPDKIIKSGCVTVVEPNFSTSESQPLAYSIYQIYKKRWLSRYWQENGIRVFVDLNVTPKCEELNFYGVPVGWNAYATRVHKNTTEEELLHQADIAKYHSRSSDILFLVYGHRKSIDELCREQGWIYVSETWPKPKDSNKKKHKMKVVA